MGDIYSNPNGAGGEDILGPTQAQNPKQSDAQRYFDFLKRITSYMNPAQIRRDASAKSSILSYEEYLEMAYENVLNDARMAIKGKRRPI
jgi:hypothetical protein